MLSTSSREWTSQRLVPVASVCGVATNLGRYCGGFWNLEQAMVIDVVGLMDGNRNGEKCVVISAQLQLIVNGSHGEQEEDDSEEEQEFKGRLGTIDRAVLLFDRW